MPAYKSSVIKEMKRIIESLQHEQQQSRHHDFQSTRSPSIAIACPRCPHDQPTKLKQYINMSAFVSHLHAEHHLAKHDAEKLVAELLATEIESVRTIKKQSKTIKDQLTK